MSRLEEYNERRRIEAARKGRRKRARNRTGIAGDVIAAKITGKPCRVCQRGPVEAHHLVPRGVWPRTRDGIDSADNIIPLCRTCHTDHHTTAHGRVPREALTTAEWALVVAVKGEAWAAIWYAETIGRTA